METQSLELSQKREKTQKTLANVMVLPVIPKVMLESLKLLDSQFTTAKELDKVIAKDQALVTKIITIANSPFYGLQRKVTTIEYAIMVLGYRELRDIISALSVAEAFKNKTDRYLNQKEFILHSYITGTTCKKLSNELGFHNSGEAFITGFLHDVGVSIIHRYMHSDFAAICELVENKKISFRDAELEVLGMTHENIGQFLLDKWNFPVDITDSVAKHHSSPTSCHNPTICSIVQMADCMTQKLKIGHFTWDRDLTLDPYTMKIFNLERDIDFEKFAAGYKDLFWEQVEFVRFLN
ncbi:MAG: HDOD domain-containing protein [Ignavibacteriaceae bacterium]|nr:HDOD domain-containing protein [Ignavibacteriaceae bacterium]